MSLHAHNVCVLNSASPLNLVSYPLVPKEILVLGVLLSTLLALERDVGCPLEPLGTACISFDVPSDLLDPPSLCHTNDMEPSPDGTSCAH